MHSNGMGQFDLPSLVNMALQTGQRALAAKQQASILKQQAKIAQANAAAAQAAASGQERPAFFGLNPTFIVGAVLLGAFLFLGKKRNR